MSPRRVSVEFRRLKSGIYRCWVYYPKSPECSTHGWINYDCTTPDLAISGALNRLRDRLIARAKRRYGAKETTILKTDPDRHQEGALQ